MSDTASGVPADPPSLVMLISQGVLDAELAAIVWLLVEGRIPLVVAAPEGRLAAGAELLAGVLASVRPDENVAALVAPLTPAGASSLIRGRRAGGVLEADSLAAVRDRLGTGALPLTADQLTFLGCVLVLGDATGGAGKRGRLRVTAAHYVRPLARDAHGHAQVLDPAVLTAWDERLGRYEHFAWGVMPEIAARLGRRAGDLDADIHHRRDDLAGLAKAKVTSLEEVRRLIAGYRTTAGGAHGDPHALAEVHRNAGQGPTAAAERHEDGDHGHRHH